MSLQTLLAEYPNYPARKVRRLAKQLAFLDNSGAPEAKGIATDLMAAAIREASEMHREDEPAEAIGGDLT